MKKQTPQKPIDKEGARERKGWGKVVGRLKCKEWRQLEGGGEKWEREGGVKVAREVVGFPYGVIR